MASFLSTGQYRINLYQTKSRGCISATPANSFLINDFPNGVYGQEVFFRQFLHRDSVSKFLYDLAVSLLQFLSVSQTLLPIVFAALDRREHKDSPLEYSFAIPWPAHREEDFLHWCISCRLPPWDDRQAAKPAYWLCDDFYSMQTSQSTGFAWSRTSLSFIIGYHFFLLRTFLSYHSIINNSMFFENSGQKSPMQTYY